ncbi:MAG: hypothetical protein ACXV5Q_11550 [Frankiaceae bacterium]
MAEGLTLRDLDGLRAAVANGLTPRVRMLARAGQVAGQRGTVVAVGQPTSEVVEYVQVRMDRDGDVLPFAPDELHLLAALPAGAAGPTAQPSPLYGRFGAVRRGRSAAPAPKGRPR